MSKTTIRVELAANDKNADSWEGARIKSQPKIRSDSIILPRIQGLRVLVLGANRKRLEMLASALRNKGVNAVVSTADENGYRAALQFAPDVVISEMAKPGDPGWWLFKRFHRHPILKWTPALLMKWWEEKDGEERILVERVFERLSEALTPIRVLEERIAAGRKLNDRVETTGIFTALKVIMDAGLVGSLSVNDSWNIFQVELEKGDLLSINRRGVDGEGHDGEDAFSQLLLCDSGHWTFRNHDLAKRPKNIQEPIGILFERTSQRITQLFGPDAVLEPTIYKRFEVKPALFHDIAATFSGVGRDILGGIAAGISQTELATLIGSESDRISVERVMVSLVRSGAVALMSKDVNRTSGSKDERIAKGVAYVLDWIAQDHRMTRAERPSIDDSGTQQGAGTGYYRFSNVETNKVGNFDHIQTPGIQTEETRDLTPIAAPDLLLSGTTPTPPLTENDSAWRRQYSDNGSASGGLFSSARIHDSLAPGPSVEERSKRQMWLAIAIAVILGGLLVAGLVLIGSGGNSEVPNRVDSSKARD